MASCSCWQILKSKSIGSVFVKELNRNCKSQNVK